MRAKTKVLCFNIWSAYYRYTIRQKCRSSSKTGCEYLVNPLKLCGCDIQSRNKGKVSRSHEREKKLIFPPFAVAAVVQLCEWVWEGAAFLNGLEVIQAVALQLPGSYSDADFQSNMDCSIVWHLLLFRLLLCRKHHFNIFHCKWSVNSLLSCERDKTKQPFGGREVHVHIHLFNEQLDPFSHAQQRNETNVSAQQKISVKVSHGCEAALARTTRLPVPLPLPRPLYLAGLFGESPCMSE